MLEDEGDHEYRDVGGASAENNDVPTGADSGPKDGKENKEPELDKGNGGPSDVGKETPSSQKPGEQPDSPISVKPKPEPDRQPEPTRPKRTAKPKKKSSWAIGGYGSRRSRKSR